MPQKQRGMAHIFLFFVLLIGLAISIYLVQHQQIFKPKASELELEYQEIKRLTDDLVEANDKFKKDQEKVGVLSEEEKQKKLNDLTALAIRRKGMLTKIIERSPKDFIVLAKLSKQVHEFPDEVKKYLETPFKGVGILSLDHYDDFKNSRTRNIYVFQPQDISTGSCLVNGF